MAEKKKDNEKKKAEKKTRKGLMIGHLPAKTGGRVEMDGRTWMNQHGRTGWHTWSSTSNIASQMTLVSTDQSVLFTNS